jgi:transcriptional regulator
VLVQDEQRLDDAEVRRLIRAHPWATLVTDGEEGLWASHMPALVDESATDRLVILSHTARADPQARRIEGGAEVLVVFQGANGFLPGEWTGGPGASTGTWNFEAAHVRGRAEPLGRDESLELLRRTFEHLESRRERPTPWGAVAETAGRIVGGTCCFRLPAIAVHAKAKLGQEKPREVREGLIAGLERPGPYAQPALARRMREALGD